MGGRTQRFKRSKMQKMQQLDGDAILKLAGQALGVSADRLRELAQADREGRVKIEQKARRCPRCGKMTLYPRIDWQYYYCYSCKTQFTKEEVEETLRREQDNG